MTARAAGTKMVALVCPGCGADLDGLAADRVFGCPACSRAFSIEPDGLREHPLVAWEPDGEGDHVFLPLWVFDVEAVVVLPPTPRASGAAAGAERLVPFPGAFVAVTAFDLLGRARFGDPGLHLTRRQPAPKPLVSRPVPSLSGAVLSRSAAEQLVPATVLAVVDARDDVFGGRADVTVGAARLALVPFARREDGGVVEPFGGLGYVPAALPDLEAILATQSR